jgi:hypothetical protein
MRSRPSNLSRGYHYHPPPRGPILCSLTSDGAARFGVRLGHRLEPAAQALQKLTAPEPFPPITSATTRRWRVSVGKTTLSRQSLACLPAIGGKGSPADGGHREKLARGRCLPVTRIARGRRSPGKDRPRTVFTGDKDRSRTSFPPNAHPHAPGPRRRRHTKTDNASAPAPMVRRCVS